MIQFLVFSDVTQDGFQSETSVPALPESNSRFRASGHIYTLGAWSVSVTEADSPYNVICANTFDVVKGASHADVGIHRRPDRHSPVRC